MSKVNAEQVKLESHGLRGSLAADLENSDAYLSEAGQLLIKFHGSYQQTDRDKRGQDKDYSFMVRSKLPGGQMSADQYLTHDDIAGKYGNDTLRITTRQGIQFHGIIKGELRDSIRELNHAFVTTFGACGDVARNVMCCPAPTTDPRRVQVQQMASMISDAVLPRTKAYHQIWLDGQELVNDEEDELYGVTYLPRKFKVAIAFEGDNCVDIFTNDVGLVAIFGTGEQSDTLLGFNVLAGGGMGVTHNNDETFARLADVVGFIEPQHAVETVRTIVTIHRDFGDRTNRKHARLKYVLHERGIEWFRQELASRVSFTLHDPRPMPTFSLDDHLGWYEQGDGKWYLGLPIQSGRIADNGSVRLRTGLRHIISTYRLPARLTAQQNIILADIQPTDKDTITALLAEYGIVTVDTLSGVRRYGLACPALPTCSLAITEAERAFPQILSDLETILSDLDLEDEPINVRMTGCPNGCARPYVSEIAFVGRSLNKYVIYLGGAADGTRLATPFLDLIPIDQLGSTLRPVFAAFVADRFPEESFGDYVARVGFDALRARIDATKQAGITQ